MNVLFSIALSICFVIHHTMIHTHNSYMQQVTSNATEQYDIDM